MEWVTCHWLNGVEHFWIFCHDCDLSLLDPSVPSTSNATSTDGHGRSRRASSSGDSSSSDSGGSGGSGGSSGSRSMKLSLQQAVMEGVVSIIPLYLDPTDPKADFFNAQQLQIHASLNRYGCTHVCHT
jgi:hypothetical protein